MVSKDHQQVLKAIGHKVRMKRLSKSLSLEALSLMINGSPSNLSQLERGKSDFNFSTLLRITEALECSILEFLPPELLQDSVQKSKP